MRDIAGFFGKKRSWSKYKDLILDYYLGPYLAKVAKLRKPIAVIDCFAGPGKFDDGESGSPLIIHKRLAEAQGRGASVQAMFIEQHETLYNRLQQNIPSGPVPVALRKGDFHQYIDEIAELAKTHSIFVYLDPLQPKHLRFNDLASVYERLRRGQSVETLVNFLSRAFTRWGEAIIAKVRESEDVYFEKSSLGVDADTVAGGQYWRDIVSDQSLSHASKIEQMAEQYRVQLGRWFSWRIAYPIREKPRRLPKYHLIFGSRHPDAIELMNQAMVTARREFVGVHYVENTMFDIRPTEEIIDEVKIRAALLSISRKRGPLSWKLLRAYTTAENPCLYLTGELNAAIKRAIKTGKLLSNCSGSKIEENARVWVPENTNSSL